MKIYHYSLGFPPYRTGGMTKFCMDLMKEQLDEGHEVALLWPGEMKLISGKNSIRKGKPVEGVESFEIVNPLPVPYDEGIKNFEAFKNSGNKKVFDRFFTKYRPDVLHIHTLMGLHMNLLASAKEHGVRLVFTTHDFFPICQKVTMFRNGQICRSVDSCEDCPACNNTALSLRKIQLLQSPLYRTVKDSGPVKRLRKRHRDTFLDEENASNQIMLAGTPEDYKQLRGHYQEMLSLLDMVHYNSTVAKKVYEEYFCIPHSCVIGITHSDIRDRRKKKKYLDSKLRIRYLGPQGGGKGFFLLKAALDKLWEERKDFCLDIHFAPTKQSPYMKVHNQYKYSELENIFDNTDILVVPSIWYETFGYTVLEALSFGTPVIISSTVGAKDILADGTGIVIDDISVEKLLNEFKAITTEKLIIMNESIIEKQSIMDLQEMENRITAECYMEA